MKVSLSRVGSMSLVVVMMASSSVEGAASEHYGPGDTFRDCGGCPEMVVVPAGSFMKGSPPGEGEEDEQPQRQVRIDEPFAIGRHEVTFDEWDACVEAGGCVVARGAALRTSCVPRTATGIPPEPGTSTPGSELSDRWIKVPSLCICAFSSRRSSYERGGSSRFNIPLPFTHFPTPPTTPSTSLPSGSSSYWKRLSSESR